MEMVEEIKTILEEVRGVPGLAGTLSATSSIVDDVGLDSLEMMTFMLALEERLHVRIDFENMEYSHLRSISALSSFLTSQERLAG